MRCFPLGVVLTVAVLLPNVGNAQVFQFRTPPPDVSAATASWQINSEALVVGGLTYYPTRGFRLFDGQVMVQTGMFEDVPVYSDTTLEPYSELYVPVGRGRMRVYERRRERELAGTTASHVPAFPVDSPSVSPPDRIVARRAHSRSWRAPVSEPLPDRQAPLHTTILNAVPRTPGVQGVWIDFEGARWYSDGPAASFTLDRFEAAGEYHGFRVYRDRIGRSADIWVSVVKDGPVAPYRKQ